jgi:hypothetical protein
MKLLILILTTFFCKEMFSQYYVPAQLSTIDSNKSAMEGDLYLDTVNEDYYIGLTHGRLGKVYPFGTNNPSTLCELLKPILDSNRYKVATNNNINLTLNGYNFLGADSVSVSINGVTINFIEVTTPSSITVNLTAGSTSDTADIIVTNSCGSDTIKKGLITVVSTWIDLRLGGDVFTTGNAPGNDIRFHSSMSITRNASGIYFTGLSPWTSWVKFESLQFTRGSSTTIEWVFEQDGQSMIGIGSLITDEFSTSQFVQGALLLYFSSISNIYGLYGGVPQGVTWSQPSPQAICACPKIYKLKIENDGAFGEQITLYELPSANPVHWDNEATVVYSITSVNNNADNTLVPFLVPRPSASNYYIAIKVL